MAFEESDEIYYDDEDKHSPLKNVLRFLMYRIAIFQKKFIAQKVFY